MTTREDIAAWFSHGAREGYRYMLVVCDTCNHEDYPVYVMTDDACLAKYKAPGYMQRVMEVYALAADMEAQLREIRAMHVPGMA